MLPFSAHCWHLRAKPLLLPQQAFPPPDVSASRLDGNGQRWGVGVGGVFECTVVGRDAHICVYIHVSLSVCVCTRGGAVRVSPSFLFPFRVHL